MENLIQGTDRILTGFIQAVLTFYLFVNSILNIAPLVYRDLGIGASSINIAVSPVALFQKFSLWFSAEWHSDEPRKNSQNKSLSQYNRLNFQVLSALTARNKTPENGGKFK